MAATGPETTSAGRRRLSQAARAAEQPVLLAFRELVKRQSRHGSLTPAVEATIAETVQYSKSKPKPPPSELKADGKGKTLTEAAEKHIGQLLPHLKVAVRNTPRLNSPAVQGVIDAFHRLWYDDRGTWRTTQWQGITTWKCPLDLWLYQDIIHQLKPGLIIETGSAYGGSASYMGFLCDLIDTGKIVSVDIAPKVDNLPEHPRVTFLRGSSTDPDIVEQVRQMITPGQPVMAILDSDHSEKHVRNELLAYADLVTPGSYLIVEDTNVNGHPARPQHGPGPMEALDWFLTQRSDYEIDESMSRYHMTLNPRGYLKRKG